MRLTRLATTAIFLLTLASGALPALAHDTDVSFEGHGWGHGVGMSQYGAEAMAEDGMTAKSIVEYYFTDAEVVPFEEAVSGWLVDDPEPLWVNLTGTPYSTAQQISLQATGEGLVFCQQEPASVGSMYEDKNGGEYSPYVELLEQRLSDPDLGYDPGPIDGLFDEATTAAVEAFQVDHDLGVDGIVGPNTKNALWPADSGDRCVIETPLTTTASVLVPNEAGSECVFEGAFAAGACIGSVRDLSETSRLVLPERKVRNGDPIELAHGHLRVRADRDWETGEFEGIHALLEIGINDYIYGIDEIIYSWSSVANEALKAQAIASRAYALGTAKGKGAESSFSKWREDSCWCHLWSNTFSQVYAGYYPETISSGVWKAAADETAGQVLHHPTAGVVTAFFSSSNGGASEANEDAWGGSPVPYLRSVADPWSLDTSGPFPNPYANWTYSFGPSTVAAKLGFDELVGVEVIETNQSGSARTVRFVGLVDGEQVTVDKSGGSVRAIFGLRSKYYDVQWGDISGASPAQTEEPPPATFKDIEGHTFESDIEWAYENGVTKGCNPPDNTLFCPDQSVSRGQMAAFLSRYLELPAASKDYFTDDDGSTFEGDINRLAEAGITKGCGGTRFCPNAEVSREQMAAFLVRAFNLAEMDHPGFNDVSDSNTFVNDIAKLATAGITKGCNPPDNTLYCPADNVTRGQMTAFLHRASQY